MIISVSLLSDQYLTCPLGAKPQDPEEELGVTTNLAGRILGEQIDGKTIDVCMEEVSE